MKIVTVQDEMGTPCSIPNEYLHNSVGYFYTILVVVFFFMDLLKFDHHVFFLEINVQ